MYFSDRIFIPSVMKITRFRNRSGGGENTDSIGMSEANIFLTDWNQDESKDRQY